MVSRDTIALSGPSITRGEERAVAAVLRSRRLALGPRVAEFERKLARYTGVRHGVAVSSGTAALHLVVRALGIGPGDEVVTTPFSFVASSNCLLYEGAMPVFCDVEPDTFNIDPAAVAAAITPRTRAILAVDVFGHPADWPALRRIARRHGLALVEDSCEALGAALGRRRCGSFGDAAVFAFYPNKQLTTGEGGMIVTNRARLAGLCRSMANQGRRERSGSWLEHVRLGFNYRMSELNAALGLAQFARISTILVRRARVARWYGQELSGIPGIELPRVRPRVRMSWFVYVVRLGPDAPARACVLAGLRSRGIECSDYFRPIHLQPCYRERFGFKPGDFPVAEAVGARTVALPFHAGLGRAEVRRVADALRVALIGPHRGGRTTAGAAGRAGRQRKKRETDSRRPEDGRRRSNGGVQ